MDSRFALPVGTIVDGSYRIERVVGSGGFGITYVAEDIKLGTTVALKEYYPFDFGDRDDALSVRPKSDRHKKTFEWGRSSFLQEARTLGRFRHPSIVRVTRVFEAHSTAYMVMDYEQGPPLEAWLKGLNGPPGQEQLDRLIIPLLGALEIMHGEKFLHRDIAPDNIIVRADGTPVLLDFGAARRAVAEMSKAITGIVKAGYSPPEQYSADGRLQGPWSDIYALGGTLYFALTGKAPEEATLRVDVDHMVSATHAAKGSYRNGFLSAVDACLKVRGSERPQSIAQLRPLLLDVPLVALSSGRGKLPSRQWPRILSVAAVTLFMLGAGYGALRYAQQLPGGSAAHDAENHRLAALIELRRKETADAATRQAELEAGRQRKEAEVARRQAELDAERRREATETARRHAELEEERRLREELERIAAEGDSKGRG